ncbi:MAG: D-glycero-beta-D-manno-heptose 1-phosphate adenylyltransferase [Cytophagales bacterium]|nr:D-glycero-beta-D-manno-heptose 1-phosphate adenylyltransferase [Cytophagales bacterium]
MNTAEKIMNTKHLTLKLKEWKAKGYKIVFTNGCFDILHLGHIDYLEKVRKFGDKLVVGLNTDDSIKQIKGQDRPVQDEKSRARVLASLEFIDAVVLFNEDTPYELIKLLAPDVLVKGDDYAVDKIVGHDIIKKNGGEVKTIPYIEGYSSSGIIEKIKSLK